MTSYGDYIQDLSQEDLTEHIKILHEVVDWEDFSLKFGIADAPQNDSSDFYKFKRSLIDYTGFKTDNLILIHSSNKKDNYVKIISDEGHTDFRRENLYLEASKDMISEKNPGNGILSVYNAQRVDTRSSYPDPDFFIAGVDLSYTVRTGVTLDKYHELVLELIPKDCEFYRPLINLSPTI
jgi:hypothetical protein